MLEHPAANILVPNGHFLWRCSTSGEQAWAAAVPLTSYCRSCTAEAANLLCPGGMQCAGPCLLAWYAG